MDENQAVKNFLGIAEENPFEQQPVETPQEATIEEETTEEKPLPFHQDPKIQRYLEKREKEIEERILSRIPAQETQSADEFQDVIDSFTTIIGNDTPEKVNALKGLEKALKGIDQKAVTRAEERINEIRQQEASEDAEALEELESHFENIEERYKVNLGEGTQTRREFVSFIEKIAPKNEYGEVKDYPDMDYAWQMFSQSKKSPTTARAKDLASRSMTRSNETAPTTPKNLSWDNVLDNLSV